MVRMSRVSMFLGIGLVTTLILLGFSTEGAAQGGRTNLTEVVKEAQDSGVPPKTLNSLLSLGYANQVDPSSMAGFVRTLVEVKRQNLPLDPFVAKIEEGLAKRVSPSVVQQVLTKKRDDYVFTQSTLTTVLKKRGQDQPIASEHLIRISESLACGVTRQTMKSHVEQAPPSATLGQIAMSLEMSASLEQHKFDREAVQRISLAGLKENYFSPETRDLGRVLVAAKQKGVSDQKIASTILEGIQRKESVMDMASRLGVKADDLSHGPSVGPGKGHPGRGADPGSHREGGRGPHGGSGSGQGGHGGGSGGDPGGGHGGGSGGDHGGGSDGGDSGGGGHGGGGHGGKD
jgi:hypothetical protein